MLNSITKNNEIQICTGRMTFLISETQMIYRIISVLIIFWMISKEIVSICFIFSIDSCFWACCFASSSQLTCYKFDNFELEPIGIRWNALYSKAPFLKVLFSWLEDLCDRASAESHGSIEPLTVGRQPMLLAHRLATRDRLTDEEVHIYKLTPSIT